MLWPHVLLPIVPDSLRELLDAPVPLLIGMPAPAPSLRKSFTNIVWVMLDEPSPKRRLQPSDRILEEVKEMYANGLKEKLKYLYNDFGHTSIVYNPNERQISSIKSVLSAMHEYLNNLLRGFPRFKGKEIIDPDKLIKSIVPRAHTADQMFLKSLLCTQLLITYLEENP